MAGKVSRRERKCQENAIAAIAMDSVGAQEAAVHADGPRPLGPTVLDLRTRLGRAAAVMLRVINVLADAALVMALLGELGLVIANVVARAYLHRSFLWTDEVARLALSILAFIGGAVAYRRGDHAHVRIIQICCPKPADEPACVLLI